MKSRKGDFTDHTSKYLTLIALIPTGCQGTKFSCNFYCNMAFNRIKKTNRTLLRDASFKSNNYNGDATNRQSSDVKKNRTRTLP